jgi:hypothetical protein
MRRELLLGNGDQGLGERSEQKLYFHRVDYHKSAWANRCFQRTFRYRRLYYHVQNLELDAGSYN